MFQRKSDSKQQIMKRSLQKFNEKAKTNLKSLTLKECIKCNACNKSFKQIQAFQIHIKQCIKTVQLKKIERPLPFKSDTPLDQTKQQFRIKKKTSAKVPYPQTQTIDRKYKPAKRQNSANKEQSTQISKNDEFLIVRNWIQNEEKSQKFQKNEKDQVKSSSDDQADQTNLEQALKSSTIIMQKIIFLTQQNCNQKQTKPIQKEQDNQQEEQQNKGKELSVKKLKEQLKYFKKSEYKQKLKLIVKFIILTNFSSDFQFDHLQCHKQQLKQIEEVIKMIGEKPNSNLTKYRQMQLSIIKTVVQELKIDEETEKKFKNQKKQISLTLTKEAIEEKYPKQENYKCVICAICSSDLNFGDYYRVLSCSHRFHCECIEQYLPDCPTCEI